MPKTKKKTKKEKEEEKKKLELIEKLKESLNSEKNKSKEHEEESGLEEELLKKLKQIPEQELQFDEASLLDLLSQKSTAPVLEQVAVSSGPRFSRRFIEEDEEEAVRSSDPFKYIPEQNAEPEKTYTASNATINVPVEQTDILQAGRKKFVPNPASFEMRSETWGPSSESSDREKVYKLERFDISQAGRENLLERKDKKYEFNKSGR